MLLGSTEQPTSVFHYFNHPQSVDGHLMTINYSIDGILRQRAGGVLSCLMRDNPRNSRHQMWLLNPRGALPLWHFATLEAFLYLDVSCMFADVTTTFLGHEYALYLEKPHLGWMQSLNYIKLSCVQCVQLSSFRGVLLLDKKPQGTTLTWFTCAHVGRIPNCWNMGANGPASPEERVLIYFLQSSGKTWMGEATVCDGPWLLLFRMTPHCSAAVPVCSVLATRVTFESQSCGLQGVG